MGWGTPCNAGTLRHYERKYGKENVEVRPDPEHKGWWSLYVNGQKRGVSFGSDCTKPCGDCYECGTAPPAEYIR